MYLNQLIRSHHCNNYMLDTQKYALPLPNLPNEIHSLRPHSQQLSIFTRDEIRKGCVWEVQLKFSSTIVQSEGLRFIYLEKPRGGLGRTEPYLCLKVRSKLIKPIKELPFSKVAQIVSEGETVEVIDGLITLKVKFTARPRAVFHKHSDMMILVVTLKRGESTICSDDKELIFRGGTGSIHSADNRNNTTKKERKDFDDEVYMPEPEEEIVNKSLPEFEDFDSTKFCSDFLQSKGDFLLGNSLETTSGLEINQYENIWPTNFENDFENPLQSQILDMSNNSLHMDDITDQFLPSELPSPPPAINNIKEEFTLVYGKRRGCCTKCQSDCSYYKGQGGRCSECGCYPSQHIDLDSPNPLKRKLEDPTEERCSKKPKGNMELFYYQKLFFGCLHYLTLQDISNVCSKAPIPIFVKDENSVYLYMNSTFCNFVLDVSRQERILNKTMNQILPQGEAMEVLKQDKFLLAQSENTLKTFEVSVKRQNFKTMKQWTTLRDGKKVIIGLVVSPI